MRAACKYQIKDEDTCKKGLKCFGGQACLGQYPQKKSAKLIIH
jgi:hypothetical protein